jgi:hypothetical protein
MSKFFKLAWSGNITRKYLEDFSKDTEATLGTKHAVISNYQTRYGDFNGDGKQDMLISYFAENYSVGGEPAKEEAHGQLVLLLGAGKKGFKDGTSLLPDQGRIADGFSMNSAVADLNGDGVDDIVLTNTNEDGRNNPWDFPNAQSALFSANGRFESVDLDFSGWGRQSVADDLNGDGLTDFAVYCWPPNGDDASTAFYFQKTDGTFTQKIVAGVGGNLFFSGDFDGDGEVELADFGAHFWTEPYGGMMHLTELNDDGSVGTTIETFQLVSRIEEGIRWTGGTATFGISVDSNGEEYLDNGLHFGATGDVNGDGAEDVIAIHHAHEIVRVSGMITEQAPPRNFLEIFSAAGGSGFEKLDIEIRGWTFTRGLLNDVKLVDWNGDGHLDIFVPWADQNKRGMTEAERVFLNDGTGNFDRLPQKYLPSGDRPWVGEFGEYVDANNDGIMDVLVRPQGDYTKFYEWDRFSESLYLGTKRIFGNRTTENPAKDGAAGFNEAYYLGQIDSSSAVMKSAGYQSALDHYLAVGKADGVFGFAAGTHVYGYRGSETIILREGNESVDAFGGDDIITGGAGADTLNGGRGSDTFVYLAVTDSGTTANTRDVIEDFVSGTDKIDLSGVDAIAGTASDDAFAFLGADGAAFTGKAGELRWYSSGSGKDAIRVIEGDVNGDGAADFQIELMGSGSIEASDLVM